MNHSKMKSPLIVILKNRKRLSLKKKKNSLRKK
jgi:hypothetical protein